MLVELPDKYRDDIRNLKICDVLISKNDNTYDDVLKRNKIRMSLFNKRFRYAKTQIKELKCKSNEYHIQI